ncbi:MAG: hypothetical protein J1F61_01900 [Clostridiales bacterium]|nr:hypothetical protein [Clostridiales bacterium]
MNLKIYGKEIKTVFDLLGQKENDITFSFSWILSKCPEFAFKFISTIDNKLDIFEYYVEAQVVETQQGVTDMEIKGNTKTGELFHIIIEAKRNYSIPDASQIEKYVTRKSFLADKRYIVTMSNMSKFVASKADYINSLKENNIQIIHIAYKEIYDSIDVLNYKKYSDKNLLTEFKNYLREIINMKDEFSNRAYCVVLSKDIASWDTTGKTTYIDVVEKYNLYYHPVGNHYPTEPVNYICFRYYGKVMGIYHVDEYTIIDNPKNVIEGFVDKTVKPHFLYKLGKKITPSHTVSTKGVHPQARRYACIDLILTEETLKDACDKTKLREKSQ